MVSDKQHVRSKLKLAHFSLRASGGVAGQPDYREHRHHRRDGEGPLPTPPRPASPRHQTEKKAQDRRRSKSALRRTWLAYVIIAVGPLTDRPPSGRGRR